MSKIWPIRAKANDQSTRETDKAATSSTSDVPPATQPPRQATEIRIAKERFLADPSVYVEPIAQSASEVHGNGDFYVSCVHCDWEADLTSVAIDALECPECGARIELDQLDSMHPPVHNERFWFERTLGVGAFGVVWKALDTQLERPVAIKVPRRRNLGRSLTQEFLAEARTAAALTHPNIASIYEIEESDGIPFIICELINGDTLERRLAQEDIGFQCAAKICRSLAIAVDHAHKHGVVHRDLKPANVIMDEADEPVITDFGLAQIGIERFANADQRVVLGTRGYMSPEQARDSRQCDARSDVFSLGAVLIQLCSSAQRSAPTTLRNLLGLPQVECIPDMSAFKQDVPRDLREICRKCVATEPDLRFQSASELANELDRFLNREPLSIRPVASWERLLLFCVRRPSIVALVLVTVLAFLTLVFAFVNLPSNNGAHGTSMKLTVERYPLSLETHDTVPRVSASRLRSSDQAKHAYCRTLLSASQTGFRSPKTTLSELHQLGEYHDFVWYVVSRKLEIAAKSSVRDRERLSKLPSDEVWEPALPVSDRWQLFLAQQKIGLIGFGDDRIHTVTRKSVRTVETPTVMAVAPISAAEVVAGYQDGTVALWNLASSEPTELSNHGQPIRYVHRGRYRRRTSLLAASELSFSLIDDWETFPTRVGNWNCGEGVKIKAIRYSPQKNQAITLDSTFHLRVWSLSRSVWQDLESSDEIGVPERIVLSSLGNRLACIGSRGVRLWRRMRNGTFTEVASIHTPQLRGLTFSSDSPERTLACWSDETLELRDTEIGELLTRLPARATVDAIFDADRRLFVLNRKGEVRIWQGRDREFVERLRAESLNHSE